MERDPEELPPDSADVITIVTPHGPADVRVGALAAQLPLPLRRPRRPVGRLGRGPEARAEFERAASLTRNERERAVFLERAARN
ncbi:MAG: hypothetical protein NVS3B24_17820 [Candidatus Dormibacteria bacterium]